MNPPPRPSGSWASLEMHHLVPSDECKLGFHSSNIVVAHPFDHATSCKLFHVGNLARSSKTCILASLLWNPLVGDFVSSSNFFNFATFGNLITVRDHSSTVRVPTGRGTLRSSPLRRMKTMLSPGIGVPAAWLPLSIGGHGIHGIGISMQLWGCQPQLGSL